MFAYCENNPIVRSDPTGEWVHIVVGAVLGGVSSLIDGYTDEKQGWALARTVGIGMISGALSAAFPARGFAIDITATCIDAAVDVLSAEKDMLGDKVASGISSIGFTAVQSAQDSYLCSSKLTEDIRTVASAIPKTKPGNNPTIKKAAKGVISDITKSAKKAVKNELTFRGAISAMKSGVSKFLGFIF